MFYMPTDFFILFRINGDQGVFITQMNKSTVATDECPRIGRFTCRTTPNSNEISGKLNMEVRTIVLDIAACKSHDNFSE